MNTADLARVRRWLAFCGALLASAAVALSAYAAHGVTAAAQAQLQLAAIFAFGHGVALAALAPRLQGRIACTALLMLLIGTVLFAGGLVAAQVFAVPARTAPFGGGLLILGWLLHAVAALRVGHERENI